MFPFSWFRKKVNPNEIVIELDIIPKVCIDKTRHTVIENTKLFAKILFELAGKPKSCLVFCCPFCGYTNAIAYKDFINDKSCAYKCSECNYTPFVSGLRDGLVFYKLENGRYGVMFAPNNLSYILNQMEKEEQKVNEQPTLKPPKLKT